MCILAESASLDLTGQQLLDLILGEAPGTIVRMDQGVNLLFANCGRAAAVIELARMFPRSRFFGLERSVPDAVAARDAVRANWLQNLWIEPAIAALPHLLGSFQFALRQPAPDGLALPEVARLLRPGGVFLDLQVDAPDLKNYREAALHVLRRVRLPDGLCTVARK